MKSSEIKPGVKAYTKITGRDHVVTVIAQSVGSNRPWIVRTPAGNNIYRSARQLRAIPAAEAARQAGLAEIEERRINRPWEKRGTAQLSPALEAACKEQEAHLRARADRELGP